MDNVLNINTGVGHRFGRFEKILPQRTQRDAEFSLV